MEIEAREFIDAAPMKTVRFGDYLANILAKYKQGNKDDYELLKHQLSDPDIKDAQIINWLQEFRTCVTQLNKDHEQLVFAVLRLPWLGRSQAVVEEFLSFLSNLVSAQTVFLRICLKMVVSNFKPARVKIQDGEVDISDSDDDDENLTRSFEHCHQALQIISRYAPSTSRFLMPVLTDHFPFVQKSARTLECYVHNLLRVTVYIPALQREILELVISKMLLLDVSAPRAEIEEMEESAEQQTSEAPQDECLFDMDEDQESGMSSAPPQTLAMAHPVAERLDQLMSVLLAYIKDVCHQNGVLHLEKTKALYRDLMILFDKLLLPTHASCHVQYCIFYLSSFRLALAEAFLDHLWKQLQNPTMASVLRQAAAGYMGSFLARARFLPTAMVRICLDQLLPWLHLYIDSQDASSRTSACDVMLHGPFYATCQAVFYTIIFRHRAIIEGNMRKGLAYLQSLNLERIVMCQLNPLKVCLPAITNMFAAITRKYQLVLCYTIIERNNRSNLPVIRSSVGGDSVAANTNPLDSFFPFDPYLLKRSGKLIEPLYQVWEEHSDCVVDILKKDGSKESVEEEDYFLRAMASPGSCDSQVRSPNSMGSPIQAFLQRPF